MNLIANRVTEKDLRQHLTGMGYVGRSAKITGLELVAIERPGWVQVFEFQMRALKQGGDWEEFFGLCRDDERSSKFEVQLFSSRQQQQQAFAGGTAGLITLERSPRHWVQYLLLIVFVFAVVLAIIGAANFQMARSTSSNDAAQQETASPVLSGTEDGATQNPD